LSAETVRAFDIIPGGICDTRRRHFTTPVGTASSPSGSLAVSPCLTVKCPDSSVERKLPPPPLSLWTNVAVLSAVDTDLPQESQATALRREARKVWVQISTHRPTPLLVSQFYRAALAKNDRL
jgi:hypothetical protein